MLPPLLNGLTDWTIALRTRAARILLAALQLAGINAGEHLLTLVPALLRARGAFQMAIACLFPGAVGSD